MKVFHEALTLTNLAKLLKKWRHSYGKELRVSVFLDLIYRHCVFSKPLHFERWLFPCPQVKRTLLDPFARASLYLWTLSAEVGTICGAEHSGLYIPAVRRSVCVL
jgi:hypothetical protein